MKDVVQRHNSEVTRVYVENANLNKYYGVDCDGEREFIMSPKYRSDEYRIICADGMTYGNCRYEHCEDKSLQGIIAAALNDGLKVYEFDSARELFKWMAGE